MAADPKSSSGRGRITQLDGLRAVAIIMVFLHHAYHAPLLWMGVDIFFVLSGFLITGILVNQTDKPFGEYIGHFYARRVRRILPPYLMLLLLNLVFFGAYWLRPWYFYLGLMNFNPLPPASLSLLWSLAVEEQFYLLWPLAVFFLSRRHLKVCSVLLLLAAPILRYTCAQFAPPHAIYFWLPFRMDTLAAGALIALLWPDLRERLQAPSRVRATVAVAAVASALSVAVLVWLGRHGITTYYSTPMGNVLIFEATLIIGVSLFLTALLGVGKRFLDLKPLLWIGRISYSLYLIHMTLLLVLPGAHHLIAAAASLAYAVAMWFLIEKPLISTGHAPDKVQLAKQAERPV